MAEDIPYCSLINSECLICSELKVVLMRPDKIPVYQFTTSIRDTSIYEGQINPLVRYVCAGTEYRIDQRAVTSVRKCLLLALRIRSTPYEDMLSANQSQSARANQVAVPGRSSNIYVTIRQERGRIMVNNLVDARIDDDDLYLARELQLYR